jgi:guanylate kinase
MKVLVIIGPSGCGKSSVLEKLHSQGRVRALPIVTERPRRAHEIEVGHAFVSSPEFDALEQQDALLEVIHPFGLPHRYGLPRLDNADGKTPAVILRAAFLPLFQKYYPDSVIYQLEAPLSAVKARLNERQDKNLGRRLQDFDHEITLGRSVAHRILVNHHKSLDELAGEVTAAMRKDGL